MSGKLVSYLTFLYVDLSSICGSQKVAEWNLFKKMLSDHQTPHATMHKQVLTHTPTSNIFDNHIVVFPTFTLKSVQD